jgi:small subunit ribosomal protein S10
MRLVFKSFNPHIILLFLEQRVFPLLRILNLTSKTSISMPVRTQRITVNKSPHVFSKSKEQFELKEYSRILILPKKFNLVSNLIKFESILKNNCVNGLSIEIKK